MSRDTFQAKGRPSGPPIRLAINVTGGVVQGISIDRDDYTVEVAVIDYDTDGASDDRLVYVKQDGGGFEEAVVSVITPHYDEPFVRDLFADLEDT